MLNESQQKPKPKPRRQHSTRKKRQDETNDVQIETEKGKEEKKNKKISQQHQQRKKTARKRNTHTSVSQGGRRACSTETRSRKNRITESATKESRTTMPVSSTLGTDYLYTGIYKGVHLEETRDVCVQSPE